MPATMDDESINRIIRQLNPGDRAVGRQKALDSACLPGVCSWFLDVSEVRNWLSGTGPQLLWLHGPSKSTGLMVTAGRLTRDSCDRQDIPKVHP